MYTFASRKVDFKSAKTCKSVLFQWVYPLASNNKKLFFRGESPACFSTATQGFPLSTSSAKVLRHHPDVSPLGRTLLVINQTGDHRAAWLFSLSSVQLLSVLQLIWPHQVLTLLLIEKEKTNYVAILSAHYLLLHSSQITSLSSAVSPASHHMTLQSSHHSDWLLYGSSDPAFSGQQLVAV